MANGKKHTPEQIVSLLRQIEVAVANGKTTPIACREGGIQTRNIPNTTSPWCFRPILHPGNTVTTVWIREHHSWSGREYEHQVDWNRLTVFEAVDDLEGLG